MTSSSVDLPQPLGPMTDPSLPLVRYQVYAGQHRERPKVAPMRLVELPQLQLAGPACQAPQARTISG